MNQDDIFNRYNEGVADVATYQAALVRGDAGSYEKCLRDAGEELSQSIEWAIKFHMERHLTPIKFRNATNKFELPRAIEDYYWYNSSEMDLWAKTVNDEDSSVDFDYIKSNRKGLTNRAKHEGGDVDFEVAKKYVEQIRLFIKDYIDDAAPLKSISDYMQPEMDKALLLYTSCDKFQTEDRSYVLIVDDLKVNKSYLSTLSRVNWSLIICLDKNADDGDFCEAAYNELGIDYHLYKLRDNIADNDISVYSTTPYIVFANGFHQSEPHYSSYREWNKARCSSKLDNKISKFAEAYCSQKVIVVSLLSDMDWNRGIYDILERNFMSLNFILANDEQGNLKSLEAIEPDSIVDPCISVQGFCTCVVNYIASNIPIGDSVQYEIPCRDGGDGLLTPKELARLQENFEVLYRGIDLGNDGVREDFLQGISVLTWEGARRQFAVKRNNFTKQYVKPIESIIQNSARGQICILHGPGYGGSTMARLLAHYFHDEYPVLILKNYKEDLISQLDSLQQKTKTVIIVFVEIPQVLSYDDFTTLYRRMNDTRPFVFVGIQRGDINSVELADKKRYIPVLDWGDDVSLLLDTFRPYLKEYADSVRIKKEREFDKILTLECPAYMRTPFYLGLLTFDERFMAIESYIDNFARMIANNEQQRKVLIYLSLCDKYAHKDLPESIFAPVFMVGNKEVFKLERYFNAADGILSSLLTAERKGPTTYWKIKHPLFSEYLLRTLLRTEGTPEDIGWHFNIGSYCCDMIEDAGKSGNFSDYLSDILKDLFIGSSAMRDGEKFTELVNLMNNEEKKLLFQTLHETYPDNPHFCSHLGRYYAKVEGNQEEAMRYANEAIMLNSEDPLLHHIKGTCLQVIIYERMEKVKETKRRIGAIDEAEYDKILELYSQAAIEFKDTRTLYQKKQREDLHGYISHIKLLIRLFDFGVTLRGLKKQDVVSQVVDPYFGWLEQAQELLDDAHRQSIGEGDVYVQDCDVDLWSQYENPSKIIEKLTNQLNTATQVTLVRRQIARLYLHNNDRYKTDNRINRRIIELMNDNFSSEPTNEKNFYIWFIAARYSALKNEQILVNLNKWRALNPTLNITFYCYVFNVINAIEGSSESITTARDLFKEMHRFGGSTSTQIREWYSKDAHSITKQSEIAPEEFKSRLPYVEGRVEEYTHEGSAIIMLDCKLPVFFKPVTSKLDKNCLNRKVRFYLGFAYDGLRAADGSVEEIKAV